MGRLLARKLEAFGPLPERDKAALFGVGIEMCRFGAGRDFVVEGSSPEGVFVIVEGFACRYKLLTCGVRHITAYLLPGDFCDLDVLLLPRVDHNVGALSACTVAHLAPKVVQDLLQCPSLARALRIATLAETANTREWLVNVGRRRAPVRVAHLLCELLARLRVVGLADGNSYDLPLTQTDLADTTGMSNVHMNRSLQELRSKGLIELRRNRVTILDPASLQTFAEFKSDYLYLDETIAA